MTTKKVQPLPVAEMTIQDVFAGMIYGNLVGSATGTMKPDVLAKNAYEMAEALVAERQARLARQPQDSTGPDKEAESWRKVINLDND